MKITVIGGGPAGLFFALLVKKRRPSWRIQVLEQNPAHNTYGWGVVFSGTALAFLQNSDRELAADLSQACEFWRDQTIVHKDQRVLIDGMPFAGISRIRLLQILQHYASKYGVEIGFSRRISDLAAFSESDLVVGADGVNSRVRELYSDAFKTERKFSSNYFIWYGTERLFATLSLIFRSNSEGVFVAHTYRYSPQRSTFLVECDADTWHRAGFETMSDSESRAYCEKVFQADLQDKRLLSNKSVWLNFPQIRNNAWYHDNVVLIGDALRSVHFSIGSGTRTAMQDAMALADACTEAEVEEPVAVILERFVAARRPDADKLLLVAEKSMLWYDGFAALMELEPLPFAMHYLTRGGRVDMQKLQQRSPRFAAAWDAYQKNRGAAHNPKWRPAQH